MKTLLTDVHPVFRPYDLQGNELRNRFVLAALTRSRTAQPGNIPTAFMADYYAQYASAGLIITEPAQVSLQGMGYSNTPGIYSLGHIRGWKQTTTAVHQAGAKLFLPLWHAGRLGSLFVNGLRPIAPSAIPAKEAKVYVLKRWISEMGEQEYRQYFENIFDAAFEHTPREDVVEVPVNRPNPMTFWDIQQVIAEFQQGAKNAISAGFDGVEIHGADGYLIDTFLRKNSNQRTDQYGGTPEKRVRILQEITQTVVDTVGKGHVGVRLSPFVRHEDMDDPEIFETLIIAAKQLNALDIAYLHVSEADWADAPQIPDSFWRVLRSAFSKTLIVTGNYTPERAEAVLSQDYVDLIGLGRHFLTNPAILRGWQWVLP